MSSSLTTIVISVSAIHLAAFAVMLWIRLRPSEADYPQGTGPSLTPCAVCGRPATHRSYDGLDPDERLDPHTGRSWSADAAHYPALCAAH